MEIFCDVGIEKLPPSLEKIDRGIQNDTLGMFTDVTCELDAELTAAVTSNNALYKSESMNLDEKLRFQKQLMINWAKSCICIDLTLDYVPEAGEDQILLPLTAGAIEWAYTNTIKEDDRLYQKTFWRIFEKILTEWKYEEKMLLKYDKKAANLLQMLTEQNYRNHLPLGTYYFLNKQRIVNGLAMKRFKRSPEVYHIFTDYINTHHIDIDYIFHSTHKMKSFKASSKLIGDKSDTQQKANFLVRPILPRDFAPISMYADKGKNMYIVLLPKLLQTTVSVTGPDSHNWYYVKLEMVTDKRFDYHRLPTGGAEFEFHIPEGYQCPPINEVETATTEGLIALHFPVNDTAPNLVL